MDGEQANRDRMRMGQPSKSNQERLDPSHNNDFHFRGFYVIHLVVVCPFPSRLDRSSLEEMLWSE